MISKGINSKLPPFCILSNVAVAVFHCLSHSRDLVDKVGAVGLGPVPVY